MSRESALFVKYALLKLYNYCNQNWNFYYFLGIIMFCNKKLFNIFLGLCIYFLQKPVKVVLENHLLNLSGHHMIRCYLVHIIFPLIYMVLF